MTNADNTKRLEWQAAEIQRLQAELYRYSQMQMDMAEMIYQLESELMQLKAGQTEVKPWMN